MKFSSAKFRSTEFQRVLGCVWLVMFTLLALSMPVAVIAEDEDEHEAIEHDRNVCDRDVCDPDVCQCGRDRCDRDDWEPDEMAEKAFGAGVACATLCIVAGLILCAIWILICVWVYRDCVAREMEDPVMWLILLQLTCLIGLVIYLIVRSPKEE